MVKQDLLNVEFSKRDLEFLEMLLNKELEDLEAGISEYQDFPDYYIKKIRSILDKLGLGEYYTT